MDQTNAHSKGNRYWLVQNKIVSKLYVDQCYSTNGPRGDEKCEDWEIGLEAALNKKKILVTSKLDKI